MQRISVCLELLLSDSLDRAISPKLHTCSHHRSTHTATEAAPEMQTTRAITSRYGCLDPVLLHKMVGGVPGKRLQLENGIRRTEENLFIL
jgi:hypothetical protein